jgi:hypothetical protein
MIDVLQAQSLPCLQIKKTDLETGKFPDLVGAAIQTAKTPPALRSGALSVF